MGSTERRVARGASLSIRRGLAVAIVATLGLSGCTHVAFTGGSMGVEATTVDDAPPAGQPFDFTANTAQISTNELALLDSTGWACSAILGAISQQAAREGRLKEAARNREFGILTYKYTVLAPGEFGGYPCGGFVKWGSVNQLQGFDGDGTGEPGFAEAGMMLYGWEEASPDWLPGIYVGGGTRPSIGWLAPTEDVGSSDIFIRLPVNFGVMISPHWAWGLALKATAGVDLISLALSAKANPFRDSWLLPFDYGVHLSWTLPIFQYGTVTAQFGWAKENAIRYDQLLMVQGQWTGSLGVVLDYDRLFASGEDDG